MIYYDITDLVRHAQHSVKVTGIQRVVLEGLRGLGQNAQPIFLSPTSGNWYLLEEFDVSQAQDLTQFQRIWECADLGAFPTYRNVRTYLDRLPLNGRVDLRKRLHRVLARVPSFRRQLNRYTIRYMFPEASGANWPKIRKMPTLESSDKLVLFGTPWNFQHDYEKLLASAHLDVEKIILVYDLIPLNSPFVPDNLRDAFRHFIPFVLRYATKVVVNSDSAGRDLRDFAYRHGMRPPTIQKVNLAHHFPPEHINRGDTSLRVRKLSIEKYALCVGSIESRKNHLNLLVLWAKFVRSDDFSGEKLVIAGNFLWDFGAIQNLLFETGHVAGSVVVIEGPSDIELRQLYENCRFTVYPSHYEGFGLPVGESLSYGKPCLHFDNSSLIEAGCGLTDVVPYHDLRWYYQSFRRLMIDDLYYKQRCHRIATYADRLRFWSDFAEEVAEILQR